MTAQLAEPLLRPKTIAIYGASDDPKKNTGRPQRYLEAYGFRGKVYPINPNRERVQGRHAFKAVADIPDQVDHALILVPQSSVLMAIKDCAASGVKVATIYTDGFAEAGVEGQREQQQVMAVANQAGMRVIGPNSIGIVNFGSALTLSAIASLDGVDIKTGSTAVVSQSGSLIGSIMSRGSARGLGFSTLVSVGNEADLGVADIVDLLVDEPETKTILLFLEAISDPVKLGQAVRRAHAAEKPVVAYKLGRSSVGRDMAVAHTGAVAGSHAAAEAFFRHHGIHRVNMFETLFEIVPLLECSAPRSGKRVAVLTTTGGGAAIVVDRLGEAGIEITNPPQSVRDAAADHGITLGQGPLIDLTMAGVRKGVYQDVLEAALRAPDIDLVLAVVGSSAQHHAELAVDGIVRAERADRPLAVFLTPEAPEALSLLRDSEIAAFRTPEGCADAITTLLCTPAPTQMPAGLEVGRSPLVGAEGSTKSTTFDEVSSRRFLESRGVGTHTYALISETEMGIPPNMTFPVVAKVISPDIPHKTEAGVVRVGVPDPDELKVCVGELYAAARRYSPDADLVGVLIEPVVDALAEVLVGFRWDVESGPIIVLGAGGILTEVYQDVSIRLAPVSEESAMEMVTEVKGLAILRGYRNLPMGDLTALAKTVSQLSKLALETDHPVLEAEINPLMVLEQSKGVVVVDALVRLAEARSD